MSEPAEHTVAAGDRAFEARVQSLADRVKSRFRYHAIDLPDGSVMPGLQSVESLRWRLDLFGLPRDLTGKRVLDIGAWDGWFSFECERRGAQVVAVDCVALDTFLEARELIGSKVEYLTLDVNELSARRLGYFDIVLFFGVLYHLRHPLLGLERCVELSTDLALVESFVIPPEQRRIGAVMEYYERAELGGQIDNWCGPSPECLMSFCRSAGFAQVELLDVTNARASVLCKRRWPEPESHLSAAPPQLHAAVNNRSFQAKFHPLKDEYLCCFFKSEESDLTPDSLFVEVDGFGTQTLVVAVDGSINGWQANCLRPPGLSPGRHEVRIRTRRSARSNAVSFTMLNDSGQEELSTDARTSTASAPEMCSAEYRASGDLRYADHRDGFLVCYFRSSVQALTPADITIDAAGRLVRAHAISSLEPGVWQANVLLTHSIAPASAIRVRLGEGPWSQAAPARDLS